MVTDIQRVLFDVGVHQRIQRSDITPLLMIIPVEVKSGTKGQMQSLHLFLAERNLPKGIRISTENFSEFGAITTVPLYAVSRVLNAG